MNGNAHYTLGTMDMPAYYESAQGLSTLATTELRHSQSFGYLDGRPRQRAPGGHWC